MGTPFLESRVRDLGMEGGGGLGKASRGRMSSPDDKPYDVDESEVTNRLYVGNLDYSTSWQDLKDHFKPCGTVVFSDVFRDERGRSKGCGIIEYETRAEALQALRSLNHTTIGDSEFKIFCREDREDRNRGGGRGKGRRERTSGRREKGGRTGSGVVITTKAYRESGVKVKKEGGNGSRQVYVGNLPFSTSWQDLKDAFKSAGSVVRAEILTTQDGKPKGCGTVLFESSADAQNAIREYHEAEFDGRVIQVHLDKFA